MGNQKGTTEKSELDGAGGIEKRREWTKSNWCSADPKHQKVPTRGM
jgi:hypothetical protein